MIRCLLATVAMALGGLLFAHPAEGKNPSFFKPVNWESYKAEPAPQFTPVGYDEMRVTVRIDPELEKLKKNPLYYEMPPDENLEYPDDQPIAEMRRETTTTTTVEQIRSTGAAACGTAGRARPGRLLQRFRERRGARLFGRRLSGRRLLGGC